MRGAYHSTAACNVQQPCNALRCCAAVAVHSHLRSVSGFSAGRMDGVVGWDFGPLGKFEGRVVASCASRVLCCSVCPALPCPALVWPPRGFPLPALSLIPTTWLLAPSYHFPPFPLLLGQQGPSSCGKPWLGLGPGHWFCYRSVCPSYRSICRGQSWVDMGGGSASHDRRVRARARDMAVPGSLSTANTTNSQHHEGSSSHLPPFPCGIPEGWSAVP